MISILLMSVFSHSLAGAPPQVFVEGEGATLFGRQQAAPIIDAVASIGNAEILDTRAKQAQGYYDELDGAVPFDSTAATTDVGNFTISGFTQSAKKSGLVLMKFWEKAVTGAKTVLSCVIDLASVRKTAAEVTDATKVQAGWLDYFWKLWSGKKETFQAAQPHHISVSAEEQRQITAFMTADSGTLAAFKQMKSFVPRWYNGKTPASDAEKQDEKNRIVMGLLSVPSTDIGRIVNELNVKVWGTTDKSIKGILDKEGLLKEERAAFESNHVPSQLKLAFWKVIWENTILKIASKKLSQERATALVAESLAELDKIAATYRTA